MKQVTLRHIAIFAALVVSPVHAATYDYTEHYDDVHKPLLPHAAIDGQIRADTATCDAIVGVQRATPSGSYRNCMMQHGWKYSFVTRQRIRTTRAPADPYFSSNVKVAPGHFIDHDSGMDCQNTGGAQVCDSPKGTVHYFDPDQNLTCTRTEMMSICTNM
jgi:hypothetical protein